MSNQKRLASDNLIILTQQTKLIPSEGGTINLADGISLVVPAGALASPAEICVALHRRDDSILFHFEPHGTVFKYPAQLTIPQTCWAESSHNPTLHTYYQSYEWSQWQLASFVTWYGTPEVFHIQIPHFSSYYFIRR